MVVQMVETVNDKCTGCHACYSVCPVKCIAMNSDNHGFLYPEIDRTQCINCNLCEEVCPIIIKQEKTAFEPTSYAAYSKNENIRLNSSSGGVFSLIAENIINNNGVVFGARFDKKFNVVHDYIDAIPDLEKIRGSKYVQSCIGDSFKQAKIFLDEGRTVLFSGTPCQIGGLRAYLKKDYSNLICQDIICHGVPSPLVWQKYLQYRENSAGASTRRTFFRHKKNGWKTYSVRLEFTNCTEYEQILSKDLFMRGFLANLFLRNSCYNCSFKSISRQADITLADFWGIWRMIPEMFDDKGTSLVVIHSKKGQFIFDNIKDNLVYQLTDIDTAIQYNSAMIKSVYKPNNRELFLSEIKNNNFKVVINKYCTDKIVNKIKKKINRSVSKIKCVFIKRR